VRKEDDNWLNKMHYFRGQRARQRVRSKKTRKEVVDKDMADLHLKSIDAVDCSRWK